ncbi:hypothetical protein GN157_03165 [Flavobacterium rakeshii]|uniref:Adenylosuccinate synthetase n=1 Tax=Flavobacterium rakeshii TaxID=1038845 RepID=A0A6N8HA25_9FLAO|nr:hypothetical protein [Flavobacterium rakeshii]MUV02700.1 hypothetical protein [Flavobacterium rakeshii]
MNNGLKKYLLLLVVVFLSAGAQAQCAMCRAALESSDSGIKPEAVNDGIVYLMAFPYILVGLVGFAVYKLRKKKTAKAE